MGATGGRRRRDAGTSGNPSRLPVLAVLVLATVGPSVAPASAVQPVLPPGPLQTGPTADLVVSPNPAEPGELVTLDARNSSTADGSIVICEFDVDGDGTYDATRENCVLETTYNTTGDYETRVRVTTSTDETATDSEALTVAENEPPTAVIAVDPENPEPGETVTLSGADSTDADGEITSYTWELPDERRTGETIQATFEAPGEYPVELVVVDDDGAQDSTTATVVVERNEPPTARLSVATAEPTVGEAVDLDAGDSTDPDGTIAVYAWDFDGDDAVDSTTEEPTTTYVPETTGSDSVWVTVIDDDGASDTAVVEFAVSEPRTPTNDATPTAEPGTETTEDDGGSVLEWLDRGLLPLVPDVLGLLLLVLLVVVGAAVSLRRRELVADKADTFRELLTRGDVRRKVAEKLSGTTVKTAAKKAVRRFSDLVEAGGEAVGEAVEGAGRAIKRYSKRFAEWLRQFGA